MSQAGRFVTAGNLGAVQTLTGNSGGPVPPTGGNINVVGDGTTIEIAGNPGTSTLTATFIGSTSVTLDGNVGSATGSTITVTTGASNAQGTALFTGSGSTLTMTFSDGNDNLGLGARTLDSLSGGVSNSGYGTGSLSALIGGDANSCFGNGSGANLTSGGSNTLIGTGAGSIVKTGNYNVALGEAAGGQWGLFSAGAESSNIAINNGGVSGENNTLRIGASTGSGSQDIAAAYICGINGVDLSTAEVVTMASDQLGSTVLTAGSGISITPGAGIVTIAATGGGGITTLDGDAGSATGATVTIKTGYINANMANGTAQLNGSGATLTLSFDDQYTNLGLGTGCFNLVDGTMGAGSNVAIGTETAPVLVSGVNNTIIGSESASLLTGNTNTAVGSTCLQGLTTGDHNICIGQNSGNNLASAETSNIYIGNLGVGNESNTIRLGGFTGGGTAQQNQTFIYGINGVDLSTAEVVTMASDQLGSTTLTAGSGITITPGSGILTIAASGGGIPWTDVTGPTQAMVANNGYISDDGATLVTLTLPATAAQGTVIWVAGNGTGLWNIAQNAGQSINFGNDTTTVGVTGSLSSTQSYDTVQLLCVVTNTTWNVITSMGNITVT